MAKQHLSEIINNNSTGFFDWRLLHKDYEIDPDTKLILIILMNDINMNGVSSFSQNVYIAKSGIYKKKVIEIFKKLEEEGVIASSSHNPGKKNKYAFIVKKYEEYLAKRYRGNTSSGIEATPVLVSRQYRLNKALR